ncbi:hypothetical protein PsorP6_011133 [Peronosclerospora sorghi]|uniref:Uncharacterized protein n=1 Tax=Peronosclerospora sorghi TaxID=230839 RepID=A0ACC0VUQ9_9STRA|nr:hypothetical protein PsorP6_011133 [Peronosclerospora sorghi]
MPSTELIPKTYVRFIHTYGESGNADEDEECEEASITEWMAADDEDTLRSVQSTPMDASTSK